MAFNSVGTKRWRVATPAPEDFIKSLSHMHPAVVQVLFNRGMQQVRDVEAYLGRETTLGDPLTLAGVAEAVALIKAD